MEPTWLYLTRGRRSLSSCAALICSGILSTGTYVILCVEPPPPQPIPLPYICFSVFCYPFDRQSCGVEFYQREETIILLPKSIEYQGPTDLEQYTVEGVFLCDAVLQVGLWFCVATQLFRTATLASRWRSTCLDLWPAACWPPSCRPPSWCWSPTWPTPSPRTTWPSSSKSTSLFSSFWQPCKLSRIFLIHYFSYSFVGLSRTLPTTAYAKMIDIWMIFCMFNPFFEVC